MITVGLTGGIGSGKTTVARIFETLDIPVYYTDPEAKRIMNTSPIVRAKLTERFGDTIYKGEQLNRAALAELIFGDADHIAYVNSVVHPEVYADFLQWKESYSDQPFVMIESAILFESGFHRLTDSIIAVTAPLEKKIERVMHRDGSTRASILKRIANQLPDDEIATRSDAVIINDDIQALIPQAERFFYLTIDNL